MPARRSGRVASRLAGRIQMSGRSSATRWSAMSDRKRRRSASARRSSIVTTDVPRARPRRGRGLTSRVLGSLTVEQASGRAGTARVGVDLAGRDHPRQCGSHRAAGDPEQFGERHERSSRAVPAGACRAAPTARATGRRRPSAPRLLDHAPCSPRSATVTSTDDRPPVVTARRRPARADAGARPTLPDTLPTGTAQRAWPAGRRAPRRAAAHPEPPQRASRSRRRCCSRSAS